MKQISCRVIFNNFSTASVLMCSKLMHAFETHKLTGLGVGYDYQVETVELGKLVVDPPTTKVDCTYVICCENDNNTDLGSNKLFGTTFIEVMKKAAALTTDSMLILSHTSTDVVMLSRHGSPSDDVRLQPHSYEWTQDVRPFLNTDFASTGTELQFVKAFLSAHEQSRERLERFDNLLGCGLEYLYQSTVEIFRADGGERNPVVDQRGMSDFERAIFKGMHVPSRSASALDRLNFSLEIFSFKGAQAQHVAYVSSERWHSGQRYSKLIDPIDKSGAKVSYAIVQNRLVYEFEFEHEEPMDELENRLRNTTCKVWSSKGMHHLLLRVEIPHDGIYIQR